MRLWAAQVAADHPGLERVGCGWSGRGQSHLPFIQWMEIIHYINALSRLVGGALADRLAVMTAIVVSGARQIGKSTLAEQLVQGEWLYRTLYDFDVLDAARRDPEALVGGNEPVTLDKCSASQV